MADIFVVDDEEEIRETLRLLLEDEGHTVYEAPDGAPALVRLREHPHPVVVLLDWLMPGMDGIQVIQAIASDASSSHRHAFLLMTAATINGQRPLPPLPPDQDVTVIAKPFDVDELVAQIDTAIVRVAVSCHAGHASSTRQHDAHRS